jgi:hypothetical protein
MDHSTIPDPDTLIDPSKDLNLSKGSVISDTKSYMQGVTDQDAPVSITIGTSWSGHGDGRDSVVFGTFADIANGSGGGAVL